MARQPSPTLVIYPHTECGDLDLERLTALAIQALPHCLDSRGSGEPLLPDLDEVEISLIDDETIARVHDEFMDDPSATDVITFHHGEILVSVDTARREGPAHGNSTFDETLLYIIHGLLHLNGHADLLESERAMMHQAQERILRGILRASSSEPSQQINC